MYKVVVITGRTLSFFTEKKYKSDIIHLQVKDRRSVKDLLESLGIPHVEVGRILINGIPAADTEILGADCTLDVYPAEPSFRDRFVLDVHLGKLAANLRMLGIYADYSRRRDDAEIEELAASQGLVILTCDKGLLMRRRVESGMLVRSRDPLVQAAEVVCRFKLDGHFYPFSRCINCGGKLLDAGSFENLPPFSAAAVPPNVKGWVETYKTCSVCGRPYWKGSHFNGMYKKIEKIQELSDAIRQTS